MYSLMRGDLVDVRFQVIEEERVEYLAEQEGGTGGAVGRDGERPGVELVVGQADYEQLPGTEMNGGSGRGVHPQAAVAVSSPSISTMGNTMGIAAEASTCLARTGPCRITTWRPTLGGRVARALMSTNTWGRPLATWVVQRVRARSTPRRKLRPKLSQETLRSIRTRQGLGVEQPLGLGASEPYAVQER